MGRSNLLESRTFSRCQHTSIRGPLSLLWVSLLAVATGPAACFVLPSSTRLRGGTGDGSRGGGGFGGCGFATASPVPRVVLGTAHHGTRWRGASTGRDHDHDNIDGKTNVMHAVASNNAGGSAGGVFSKHSWSEPQQPEQGVVVSTTDVNVRAGGGFKAATAAAAIFSRSKKRKMLGASSTGVDVESAVTGAGSRAKRILILMSDTGGGHRASSEALSAALRDLYGHQVCVLIGLVDCWCRALLAGQCAGCWPARETCTTDVTKSAAVPTVYGTVEVNRCAVSYIQ